MKIDTAVFLYDESGIAAKPWADAGVRCYCVDMEHSIRRDRVEGNIHYVWGDARSWTPPSDSNLIFMGAFPVCTNVSGSGARDFKKKRGFLLRDSIAMFEIARMAGEWSGAPYFIENPIGVLSSVPHIGKPNYYFDPCDFAGYLPDAEQNDDAYTKRTCLWVGGGFVIPPHKHVIPIQGSKMWKMTPGDDRQKERSKTPKGFAQAVFMENYIR